jgi:hypothetical protein
MKLVNSSEFRRLSQAGLATFSSNVVNLMTTNPIFTSLTAEVTELNKRTEAYSVALTNNVNGGRLQTIEKDKCLKDVLDQLTITAFLVDVLANGDESVILAAGFSIRKAPTNYTYLAAPIILKAENEKAPGVAKIEIEKVAGATNYGIEKRIIVDGQPAGAWTNGEYTSSAKTTIENLQSNTDYEFRLRAIGSKGLVSEWSAMVSVRVS